MNTDTKLKDVIHILDDIIVNYDSKHIEGIYDDVVIRKIGMMRNEIGKIIIESLGVEQLSKLEDNHAKTE